MKAMEVGVSPKCQYINACSMDKNRRKLKFVYSWKTKMSLEIA